MKSSVRERSAGGLVIQAGKIAMIQVKNLEGRILWTFPKGHVESGESDASAALREVNEETGWQCEILGSTQFALVHYQFKRANQPVDKTVVWFVMRPIKKVQKRDPQEILKTGWFSLKRAEGIVVYPSDKKLLSKLKKNSLRF